ncbi:MAG: sulfatase-like hydrolase/transferase [Edaphobacter sp.]
MPKISRRNFMSTAAAALVATSLKGTAQKPSSTSRPNVLLILTDEQSLWTLSAYGGALPGTPNIDSIGKEGVIFRNFFVTSAICTPSRGCYMTGRYPYSNGAVRNNVPIHPDEFTLGNMFKNAGYQTGYVGKWHLDGTYDPTLPDWIPAERSFGFTDHQWMYNRGHWKRIVERPHEWPENLSHGTVSAEDKVYTSAKADGRPDENYNVKTTGEYFTNWLTDKAVDFIRLPRTDPFFCVVSYPDPHPPFSVSEPYASMFAPSSMKLPETFYQKDQPVWAEQQLQEILKREQVTGRDDPRRVKIFQKSKAEYLGEVKCIDDQVGRILKTLRESGQLDDTLIIFASDHGEYMGEHGLYFKNNLYEAAHHVGMLMRWPAGIRPGTDVEDCVANVDLLPTLAGMLSLKTSGREQGQDASQLLRGDTAGWRDEAFIHRDNFSQSGVFTREWELGLNKGGGSILFNRKTDPLQTHNLYNDPAHKSIVADLTKRTIQHNKAVGASQELMAWLTAAT